jgi:hypothetical protein
MTVGRPSKYDPAFGDRIIELMSEGLSLTAAAAELNVHRDTVYEWASAHPAFSDSKKLASGKRQLFLERRLLSATEGPVVTSSIFALKNAAPDDWRDKAEVEHGLTNDLADLIAQRRLRVSGLENGD